MAASVRHERAKRRVPLEQQATTTRWGSVRNHRATSSYARSLTPARIAAILKEADAGYPFRLASLLDEVEDREPHLVSVLGTRKRSVANLAWEIEPAGDKRQDRRVAEFCGRHLQAIDNLEDGLVDLLDAVHKGYAGVEIEWYQRDGVVGIDHLEYVPQKWFLPSPDDPNCWHLLDDANRTEGVPLEPWRFCIHVSKAKSGYPVKAGLGRVLVWWYLFKNYAIKDWVTYSELYGSPTRVGKYEMGAQPSDIDDLFVALKQLGVDAAAVIPANMDVEFHGVEGKAGGPDVYERLATFCERGMSKAVLGQTLTTDEGKNGSRALGQVHNDVRDDIKVSDAKQLARTIKRDILTPLVTFNFGPDVGVPTLVFDTEPPADEKVVAETQKVRGEVLRQAIAMGVPVTLDQLREELGIQEAHAGQEVLVRAPEKAPPGERDEGLTDSAEVDARASASASCCPATFSDDPHVDQVAAAADRYRAEGESAWGDLVDAIKAEVRSSPSLEAARARFAAIAESLELGDFADSLGDATFTGELVGRWQADQVDDTAELKGMPNVPPREAAAWWAQKRIVTRDQFDAMAATHRSEGFTIARFQTLEALELAHTALSKTIEEGGTFDEFEDAMDAAYAREGIDPSKPWHLNTVYRNATFQAYSVGRTRAQLANIDRRPYGVYRTLEDSDVRPAHAAMENRVYRLDHPIWDAWNPPNGHGCRCYRSALTDQDLVDQGLDVQDDFPTNLATGRPLTPDRGFDRDPAKQPHEFDFSRFPKTWRRALGAP